MHSGCLFVAALFFLHDLFAKPLINVQTSVADCANVLAREAILMIWSKKNN